MINQLNRREFLGATAGIAGTKLIKPNLTAEKISKTWDPEKPKIITGEELTVQPILMYESYQRREQTSWRPWGGILTHEAAKEEEIRIKGDLTMLSGLAEFPIKILPLATVTTAEEAAAARDVDADVLLIFAASGRILEECVSPSKSNLIFVRHKSGPIYQWYEIVHCRFLRKGGKNFELNNYRYPAGMDVHDVVVDDIQDVLMRLRALYGLKNFIGTRIVALGGSGGWGCPPAPALARDKFKIDIVEVSYDDLEKRIRSARADNSKVRQAEKTAAQYLNQGGITLDTKKQFVVNAFVLYDIFKDYLREYNAPAFTIKNCMSTVIPIGETTACLPLSLLNDEGLIAFCESDFNIIPSGILLHYISGKPVFLNDPTYPHHGMVTCAHCTAPRRMDGKTYENALVLTHFESDYGATPKVNFRKDQEITMIVEDCIQEKWVGFKGTVIDSPFYPICRSQCDIRIGGDWKQLMEDMRGFHWMMSYGNYMDEMEYAVRKAGLKWLGIS